MMAEAEARRAAEAEYERRRAAAREAEIRGISEEQRQTEAARARAERRARALAALKAQLEGLEAAESRALAAVKARPGEASAEQLDGLYTAARQAVALANDLARVTGDHRFRRVWNLRAALGPELAARVPALMLPPNMPKPAISQPWKPLLAVLASEGVREIRPERRPTHEPRRGQGPSDRRPRHDTRARC